METITWNDFEQVELRTGTIIRAETFPEAHKPAYKLSIDFGALIGVKKTSAQITDQYTIEELIGKQIIAVVNLSPKQIGPLMSECLVTGFPDADGEIVLAIPEKKIENGMKLF